MKETQEDLKRQAAVERVAKALSEEVWGSYDGDINLSYQDIAKIAISAYEGEI